MKIGWLCWVLLVRLLVFLAIVNLLIARSPDF